MNSASTVTTPTPGSIVVGIDGSKDGERALLWAAEQAEHEGRTLTILNGAEDVPVLGEGWLAEAGIDRAQLHRSLELSANAVVESAAELVSSQHPELAVETCVIYDDPRTALTDVSPHAHLMVIGSRGRGSFRSTVLGSVSVGVARVASCPVVVCRPREGEESTRGVVVGADGSAESVPVIEFAYRQASLRGLPLTVMHCVWDVAAMSAEWPVRAPEEAEGAEGHVLLGESVAGLGEKYPDVVVELELSVGLVDQCLTGVSREMDLVVVGRHHYGALSRLIYGSMSIAVLERAHTAVALVPEASPES